MTDSLSFTAQDLSKAGDQAGTLAGELQSARSGWLKAIKDPGVLGLDEAVKALVDTQQTWSQELDVYITTLNELAEKLHASARNNQKAEDDTFATVRRLSPY